MNDALLRQVVKQLKILNFWIAFFGVLFIIGFIISGIVLYKIATYTNNSVKKFETFQQQTSKSLDVKQQLCSDSSVGALLGSRTSLCK